jgi:hypothetical protein
MYFSIVIYFKKLFYPNIEQDIDYNTEKNENKEIKISLKTSFCIL